MTERFTLPRRRDLKPAEDYGFFGPGSVTWKVWSYPTSLTVGFQRAVVVEELDPALVTAVTHTYDIFKRPRTRYSRTLSYFALVAFGDTRTTAKAADVLVKVHSKAVGTEPLSGRPYDANDPDSQLWIHLTAWHSILYAYEKYGPGKLSPEEEARYWEECAVAAELQTCDPADVPRTREGVREYFERMRPQLVGSEMARNAMNHLLDSKVMLPDLRWPVRLVAEVISAFIDTATLATMPRWMRDMAGLPQSRLVDALIVPVMRMGFGFVHLSRRLELVLLALLSPRTVPIAGPVLLRVPPQNAETLTPAQARERYGYAKPSEAHPELRRKQKDKAHAGMRTSDEGLHESEPYLGTA
ncbi:oxygenase MpaB family protein [Streptomyces sp. B1866]|uniref:oxygenase MpaB family protein n=1 Tax=Streptomyces sp. B1866 TaxID=3075431 RepID=UPI00288FD522|nr:oxygenase MpaB family protein [Streptomyces sp. B1866]MDT3397268.1 oxygenase MpaB family protein [Streptomyces sp. B1866]